jgi:hypothetical protein
LIRDEGVNQDDEVEKGINSFELISKHEEDKIIFRLYDFLVKKLKYKEKRQKVIYREIFIDHQMEKYFKQ